MQTKLEKTRMWLKSTGTEALLVRSTDKYFNEYVPKYLSIRAQISGFNGSVGDLIITADQAHLFVDGRYSLQARDEAKDFTVHVSKNNQSIENMWLDFLSQTLIKGQVLALDPGTIDLNLYNKLSEIALKTGAKTSLNAQELFNSLLEPGQDLDLEVWAVEENICGPSSEQKIATLKSSLKDLGLDGFLLVKLDDIAWALNLRSDHFPYQCSIPAIACLLPNKIIAGFARGTEMGRKLLGNYIEVVDESMFFQALKRQITPGFMMGIDALETSLGHEVELKSCNIAIKKVSNPLTLIKAIKNEKELLHMRSAFKKADSVVDQTQNFVINSYEKGLKLSEGDIDDKLQEYFAESAAKDLSFRPICAGGKNGAIIHYGTPDRQKKLEQGALFLLDTGAYYEGGYATDLTRTFLLANSQTQAQKWQKQMFTLVLQASIRGLSARFKRGTTGMQLDAIVRQPLWQAGLDFAHGTGHGVGINVHEFPPRIGPTSTTVLLESQVFSIEPGLYFEGVGGVRIENLATIVADPKMPDFLRVLPLTFCPLDKKLIDLDMLDKYEHTFLEYFYEQYHNDAPMPDLPPLKDIAFT